MLLLKSIRVHYNKREAVKGISLKVGEGDFVVVIGPNGAGKTSVLNVISGVINPSEGEVWFRSERIDRLAPEKIAARGIIHVPEGRRIFPKLTVMENLQMGAYLQKDKTKVERELERIFHLFPILKERTRQRGESLSGGEQQMLAIGRGLMAGPALLLIDEPSLGLSPLVTQHVAEQMTVINREGIAILLVEQNARMGLKLANRGYVLTNGDLVLEGTTAELVKNEEIRKAYLGL
ncbi:MAG: ABC transporter ATP-binding protein [Dehalococcoidia bacterium]|nr:MAG: ABC transporter ATP-binding protein [Dehalococcoidia bacterium]